MVSLKYVLFAITLCLAITVAQAESAGENASPQGFNAPRDNMLTGGQPSQAELQTLKDAGVKKVVNLRGKEEALPFDEKAEVEALGLEYVSLPISGAVDVNSVNAHKLHEILQGDEKLFLHCSTGNRAGALLAIVAHEIEGKSVDEALQFGREAGLGSLEDKVKLVLEKEQ